VSGTAYHTLNRSHRLHPWGGDATGLG